jgi:hypothetical protein
MAGTKTTSKPDTKYCDIHKAIRELALYKRGTRMGGQRFIHVGSVCPICGKPQVDMEALTKTG